MTDTKSPMSTSSASRASSSASSSASNRNATSSGRTRKRVRGPFVVVGLSVLILSVFGFAFGMWWSKREPRGPILAIAPIGDGRVALLRRGFEERGYIHVVVEEGPKQLWSEALFGVPDAPSITRFGDHVVLRAREARGHVEIHAFDRTSGVFRWRGGRGTRENAAENRSGLPPFASRSLFATDAHLFVVHGGASPEVVVIDLEGTELGRVELDGVAPEAADADGADAEGVSADGSSAGVNADERRAALFDDSLVLTTGDGQLRVIDAQAQVRTLGAITHGWCATEDALYVGDPRGLAVHRAGREAQDVYGDGLPLTVHACAEREAHPGEAWLVVTTPSGERAMQRVGPDGLLGGYAIPAWIGAGELRIGHERLVATGDAHDVDVFELGESAATKVVDGAGEVELVGRAIVVRTGNTIRIGDAEANVEDARGMVADDTHVMVWSEHELVRFDTTLRRLD